MERNRGCVCGAAGSGSGAGCVTCGGGPLGEDVTPPPPLGWPRGALPVPLPLSSDRCMPLPPADSREVGDGCAAGSELPVGDATELLPLPTSEWRWGATPPPVAVLSGGGRGVARRAASVPGGACDGDDANAPSTGPDALDAAGASGSGGGAGNAWLKGDAAGAGGAAERARGMTAGAASMVGTGGGGAECARPTDTLPGDTGGDAMAATKAAASASVASANCTPGTSIRRSAPDRVP
jgi:hypothetical protein